MVDRAVAPRTGDAAGTGSKRPKDRADRILVTAAALFRERGYHGTGIDDIGEAVGISGPAVYRHYKSKEALLFAVAQRAAEHHHQAFQSAVVSTADPDSRLEAVIRGGVGSTIDHLDASEVFLHEWRRIAPDHNRPLRDLDRKNNRILIDAVLEVRPDLSHWQVRFMLQSIAGLYLSILFHKPQQSRARLEDILTTMGVAALRAGPAVDLRGFTRDDLVDDHGTPRVIEGHDQYAQRASRREMILSAATRLFRERGFNGVGIDDIGEAAGIAGPGVYRHFRNKEDVLVAGFSRAGEQVAASATRALALSTPRESLDSLIESYVDIAIENADMISVYLTEAHALGGERRRAVTRSQRAYVDEWCLVYRSFRPETSEADTRTIVQAAIGIVNGYAIGRIRLPTEATRSVLVSMVAAALYADGLTG